PRAFQTIVVPSWGTKDRLEWECKVLAAARKQSMELGDIDGMRLAHDHLFALLNSAKQMESSANHATVALAIARSASSMSETELIGKSTASIRKRGKVSMPDIYWSDDSESG